MRSGTLRVFYVSLGYLILLTCLYNLPHPAEGNLSFAWEYGNIAQSIVQGTGFSSPFGGHTGATGWMPPLLPSLLAVTFYLLGTKSMLALWTILITKCVFIAASWAMLYAIVKSSPFSHLRCLLIPIFFGHAFVENWAFSNLTDTWFTVFLSSLSLYSVLDFIINENKPLLIVVALILPLAHPILSAVFLIFLFLLFVASQNRKIAAMAMLALLFTTGLGIARTSNGLGEPAFTKTNFWYDFYLSNFLDADGVPTNTTFIQWHPMVSLKTRSQYAILGETEFMRHYRDEVLLNMHPNATGILKRIRNRFFNAFVRTDINNDAIRVSASSFDSTDLEKLLEYEVILVSNVAAPYWNHIQDSPLQQSQRLSQLKLQNQTLVFEQWLKNHELYERNAANWPTKVFSVSISGLPFFCSLCLLLSSRARKEPVVAFTIVGFFAYLTPYAITSHYSRYQIGILNISSLLIFLFFAILLNAARKIVSNIKFVGYNLVSLYLRKGNRKRNDTASETQAFQGPP